MRFHLVVLLLACLTAVLAWDKNDFEIFDLVSALEAAEGKGTSFYSHLSVDPSASTTEITKAYRKKSLALHPDKNPGVKDIEARFARLGVIAQILRDPARRERYNFFYKNGVPTWKGLGYAYTRWRPSLLHVLGFLALLSSGFQYLFLRLNHARDLGRVRYFDMAARKAAGNAQGRRRVKVPMVEGGFGADVLELVVDGDDVYLPHDDGSLTPISTLAKRPTASSLWPARLVLSALSPLLPKPARTVADADDESSTEPDADELSGIDTPTPAPRKPAARKGRAAELRAQRIAGRKADSETDTADDASGTGTEGEDAARPRKALGKAGAARRRKMARK
ncbi:hypothetical protein Q5752_004378 [Cryptotrichosporon argae]